MTNKKTPLGVKIIAIFYCLLAVAFVIIFIYFGIITPQISILLKILGFLIGILLTYSIFFMSKHLWQGSGIARLFAVLISGYVCFFGLWDILAGKIILFDGFLSPITILIINVLIIIYLLSNTANRFYGSLKDNFRNLKD